MSEKLIKKQGNLPRRKEDDPFFAIWRHYHDPNCDIVLSDNQKKRLKVYEFAYDIYNKGFSRGEAAKYLVEHFKDPENGGIEFSVRTAFQYLRDALDLFGEMDEINLNRERMSMIEIGKSLITEARQYGDYKGAASVYQTLVKLYQFDKDNNEVLALLKKLKPMQITITNDPNVLKKEADELMMDIDHEDVTEDQ